jgi:hypothetical protein
MQRRTSFSKAWACAAASLIAGALHASPQVSTTLVSLSSGGVQANQTSYGPAISVDARYVAFESSANNLVVGDTNGFLDVFVHDRQTGTTTLVSLSTAGGQGDHHSYECSISGDGRYVAFKSQATNLVAADTNNVSDLFVRDRQTGTTTRVSVDSSGAQADNGTEQGVISADGRFVAFASDASNLVASDTNASEDVFVHDLVTGATTRASVDSNGVEGNDASLIPALSGDGRFVAFGSYATNLVAGDGNGTIDIFVHDRQTGATTRVSVDSGGVESNSYSYYPGLSADGRYVAFLCAGDNLVPSDGNFADDVFVHDRTTGITTRVSVDSFGVEGDDSCDVPAISADGRSVGFASYATNLVGNDSNSLLDVFVHDRVSGTTVRVSESSSGTEGNSDSLDPALSGDGRVVAFDSDASNLVAVDTNNTYDIFVRDQGPGGPTVYCTAGTTSHGCVPWISSSGTPSATSGSGFTIVANAVEGQKQGILFYGIDNSGFTPVPWGASTSFLCVKPPTQRTSPRNAGGTPNSCDGALSLDWNAYIAANPGALGNPFAAGQHVFAQGWFRDPPSPKTTMLSDALEFVVGP